MEKYIQITAGRRPVECTHAVTLVARELLKDFPDAELMEFEMYHTEPDCYMSMLFLAETDTVRERKLQQSKNIIALFDISKWGNILLNFIKCQMRFF